MFYLKQGTLYLELHIYPTAITPVVVGIHFPAFTTVIMSGDKQATLLCAMQIRQMATEGFHCSTKTVRTDCPHIKLHMTGKEGRRYSGN